MERNWQADGYDIWFFTNQGGITRVLRLDADGRHVWADTDPNVRADPSLHLPVEALEQLLAAAGDVLPVTAATERHLADAQQTRDRLLALVEQGWTNIVAAETPQVVAYDPGAG